MKWPPETQPAPVLFAEKASVSPSIRFIPVLVRRSSCAGFVPHGSRKRHERVADEQSAISGGGDETTFSIFENDEGDHPANAKSPSRAMLNTPEAELTESLPV